MIFWNLLIFKRETRPKVLYFLGLINGFCIMCFHILVLFDFRDLFHVVCIFHFWNKSYRLASNKIWTESCWKKRIYLIMSWSFFLLISECKIRIPIILNWHLTWIVWLVTCLFIPFEISWKQTSSHSKQSQLKVQLETYPSAIPGQVLSYSMSTSFCNETEKHRTD